MHIPSKKRAHVEEILMKLNVGVFLSKNDELLEKYNEIWKKSIMPSKKNLIVNLCKTQDV